MDTFSLDTRSKSTMALLQRFLQDPDLQEELEDLREGMFDHLHEERWSAEEIRNVCMALLLITSLGHRGVAIRSMTVGEWTGRKMIGHGETQAVLVRVKAHKTRKFYGPADVVITRPYIRYLIQVSG